MIILSKYSVLEYLIWLKNNKYQAQEAQNELFYNIISTNDILKIQVVDIDISTRNLVFEFLVDNNQYIFKQFGPDLIKKRPFFISEILILNQEFDYTPQKVFQDELNNIVITEKLVAYENFSSTLRTLFNNYKDVRIKLLLKTLALKLREIHSVVTVVDNQQISKYSKTSWRHFFIDNPEFESIYIEFISFWKASGLVHYDLKSDNVLVSEVEGIKIIDWEMSEIGDCFYDLCSVVRMIYLTLIGPYFLNFRLPYNYREMKKFVDYFLDEYSDTINRTKLINSFKIYNYDLYNKDYYFSNIDTLLS
jgi:thiamine kinase-like enzyme